VGWPSWAEARSCVRRDLVPEHEADRVRGPFRREVEVEEVEDEGRKAWFGAT
jgi:hypothetical protein